MRKEDRINGSGCVDLTAYEAIKNIEDEEVRFKKLLHTIFYMCDLANFELGGRIVLIDKKTGKIWR